jgi:cobalamin biosynthesis protein CobT
VVVFVAAAAGRPRGEINKGKGSSMRLLTRRKKPIDDLKDAAIEALANALDDDKRAAKPGMTGVRALATGAVIYTAGRAAFKGRRFVREQLSSDTEDDQAEDLEDEEETRAYEEPEGEEYELDEEEDEPDASEEDEDEPDAIEEDEDEPDAIEEDEDEPDAIEEDERTPMRRAARKKGAQPSLKLPNHRRARTPMFRG